MSTTVASSVAAAGKRSFFHFGPNTIPLSQTFLISKLCYAFVNLKPVRPGHVLVATQRKVARFNDLTSDEVSDLFAQGQRVSKMIERVYQAKGLTVTIQDGAAAGQTVSHVHLHVIPRHPGDFANNDDIYSELEKNKLINESKSNAVATGVVATSHVDNDKRTPRTPEDMAAEADILRKEIGA
ncbi:Dinucleoside triphosphate hydrolase [Coemansia sp. RSA 1813]|nr:Dinucleoside triphosphate hydrolase [Coemansia sp. RSA 1646]KAJ1767844.1 Dinucleoside triphosphate hydrolase [Coemansia sp. RSA 1843]KAJ2211032.1 Dinucleoside triphosphate hydrolase [Coemansia sp. RSA 487]KAJ2564279.1 Dinucleoside triphosphate hydrolase [Coemansia sp. RSA 1813]